MSSDNLDDLITGLEGRSMYTAPQKSKDDQRKTLQPEGGNEITDADQNPKPRIQKVSKMLRDNKNMEKYYEPRAVSIGLLHYGRDKFSLAEGHKLHLADLFVNENGVDEFGLESKIKTKVARLKQCYAEEDAKRVNISDENLAWMFLIDGFVLLHYICYASLGKLNDLKKIGMDIEAFSHDLFLLENQLPYEVLEDIMTSATKGGANMRNLIDKFIDQTVEDIRGSPSPTSTSTSTSPQQQQPPPAHLLQLLRNRLVGDHDRHKTDEKTKTGKRVGRVNELKSAGIQLKSGREGSLRDDISFASHWITGTLTLPCIAFNDSTAPKLLNLIAFEMCPDFQDDSRVITSYIFFLHSLIDQPDDVKELRKAHVLINNNNNNDAVARSDEEVARLFKEIGSSDVDSIPGAYLEVKELIQKHCEKKWKTWTADAFNNRFSGRWTLFAFAAAIALLVISFSSRLGAPLNLSAK
ncbi:hypothetical protein Dsin_011943 [Dipteronia sinensis]|uniref:Uncharacterized protein n=1 Tax=Dipteronia sinensis TaxID=43782 RepID=A0AAE0E7G6_9ROSI|nr:hypothetical protein Dsin_011943 [Dipteronia sinensis]